MNNQSPALSVNSAVQKTSQIVDAVLVRNHAEFVADILKLYPYRTNYWYSIKPFIEFVSGYPIQIKNGSADNNDPNNHRPVVLYGYSLEDYLKHLHAYKNEKGIGYKPTTIKRHFIVARDYCQILYKRRYNSPMKIQTDITLLANGKKLKNPKVQKQLKSDFRKDELKRILDYYRSTDDLRLKALISLLYFGAYRIGEVANLKWSDVDFNKRTISVIGKGGQPNVKTMHPEIENCLKNIVSEKPSSPVFSLINGKPISKRTLQRWITLMLDRLNIKGYSAHTFRHSSIMELVRAGFSIEELKYHSRHAGLSGLSAYISHIQAENSSKKIAKTLTDMSDRK